MSLSLRTKSIIALLTFSVVGIVGVVTYQLTRAIEIPENDEPEDIIACNGVSEDVFSKDSTSRYDEQWPPAHADGTNIVFDYNLNDIVGRTSAQVNPPRATVFISSRTAQTSVDEYINIAALPEYFSTNKSNMGDLSMSWSVDGISLMGVAAGADPRNLPESGGFHCSTVTRTPVVDVDGDGMDDDWERRYFVDTGIFNTIEEVLPGDDYDNDGVLANQFQSSDTGAYLVNAPATSAGPPGSGKFTNLEEYIWGTDPIDADTDDDGYRDGDDILGIGQINLDFDPTVFLKEGDNRYDVRLTVLGYWVSQDSENNKIIKLDSIKETVVVSEEENMTVSLRLQNKKTPVPGETVTVQAQVRDTRALSDTLSYRWFVNDVEQTEANGIGAHILNYDLAATVEPETFVEIRVIALNETTGDQAENRLTFKTGTLVAFEYDPAKVYQGNEVTVAAIFPANLDPDDYVFRWLLDDSEQSKQSGPGQTTFDFTVKRSEYDTHKVTLRVINKVDSTYLAEIVQEIGITAPSVNLVITPEVVEPGGIVTLQAETKSFGSTNLQYTWRVDGNPVDFDASSILSFMVGEAGATHIVELTVEDLRSSPSVTADAIAQIIVSGIAGETSGGGIANFTASLLKSAPKIALTVAGFLMLMIAIFAILRSVAASTKKIT